MMGQYYITVEGGLPPLSFSHTQITSLVTIGKIIFMFENLIKIKISIICILWNLIYLYVIINIDRINSTILNNMFKYFLKILDLNKI
jgi:NADH dehydrogenase FAD-containing subunit